MIGHNSDHVVETSLNPQTAIHLVNAATIDRNWQRRSMYPYFGMGKSCWTD
jgi:hypothetical protein